MAANWCRNSGIWRNLCLLEEARICNEDILAQRCQTSPPCIINFFICQKRPALRWRPRPSPSSRTIYHTSHKPKPWTQWLNGSFEELNEQFSQTWEWCWFEFRIFSQVTPTLKSLKRSLRKTEEKKKTLKDAQGQPPSAIEATAKHVLWYSQWLVRRLVTYSVFWIGSSRSNQPSMDNSNFEKWPMTKHCNWS